MTIHPWAKKVLSKKFRRGRCPGYSHRTNITNATTTAVTNTASNTNGILVGL
jgi:hypothetical protein